MNLRDSSLWNHHKKKGFNTETINATFKSELRTFTKPGSWLRNQHQEPGAQHKTQGTDPTVMMIMEQNDGVWSRTTDTTVMWGNVEESVLHPWDTDTRIKSTSQRLREIKTSHQIQHWIQLHRVLRTQSVHLGRDPNTTRPTEWSTEHWTQHWHSKISKSGTRFTNITNTHTKKKKPRKLCKSVFQVQKEEMMGGKKKKRKDTKGSVYVC